MSVRRVRVHADRDGDPVSVDVALPAGAPVGELMPAIIDMVDDRAAPEAAAHCWRLDRPTGSCLDESLSLVDNGIHDGELLILARGHPHAPGFVRTDPCHVVLDARPPEGVTGAIVRNLPAGLGAVLTVLASAAFASTAGSPTATTNAIVAAVGVCAAVAVARANGYPTSSNLSVVALAAATGFVAVPSGPAAPNVFLAAMAGFSASLLTSRLSGRAAPELTAVGALSLLVALVTVVAIPVAVVAVALATVSLALLVLAPRLAVLAAGLGPDHWRDDVADRAQAGHGTLSGLVAGAAVGCAAGCAVVAATGSTSEPGTIAFTGLVAAVLLLRARTYVDPARRIVLVTTGVASGAACVWTAGVSYPHLLGPIGAAFVAVGLAATRSPRANPAAARMLGVLEYTAQATVVPVACWIGGLYGFVGELHLS